jgi:hypothetical protein
MTVMRAYMGGQSFQAKDGVTCGALAKAKQMDANFLELVTHGTILNSTGKWNGICFKAINGFGFFYYTEPAILTRTIFTPCFSNAFM